MQQTNSAYQYIFGADHGEDSLARELIRRSSNVILLDEFDKVSPSFYNAFYQMHDIFDVLRFITEHQMSILRIERVEPTLETLFMEVVEQ